MKTSGTFDNIETEAAPCLVKENLLNIEEDSFEDTKAQYDLSEDKFGKKDTGVEENELVNKPSVDEKPVTKEEFLMLMEKFREQCKADREEIFKDFRKTNEDG